MKRLTVTGYHRSIHTRHQITHLQCQNRGQADQVMSDLQVSGTKEIQV